MNAVEPVSLPDLVSACLKGLERSLAGRDVRIVSQIDRTAPIVSVDRARVRAVVDSLLAEAARSTPEGGRVRVCLKHSPAAVMLSIKDGGPGMSEAEREALLSDSARRRAPGAAMSPADCRLTVADLGGNFFVNSMKGKGSTYYVTFPSPAGP